MSIVKSRSVILASQEPWQIWKRQGSTLTILLSLRSSACSKEWPSTDANPQPEAPRKWRSKIQTVQNESCPISSCRIIHLRRKFSGIHSNTNSISNCGRGILVDSCRQLGRRSRRGRESWRRMSFRGGTALPKSSSVSLNTITQSMFGALAALSESCCIALSRTCRSKSRPNEASSLETQAIRCRLSDPRGR